MPLKFVDLFAGLGGFHLALKKLGHECVFASELIPELRDLYKINHDMECAGDINEVNIQEIPEHDVLCSGFPCQPFSQAGFQQGFNDTKERGNLFYRIMDILEYHKPEFVFLENVPNLKSHDKGNTYEVIHNELSRFYDVKEDILSPHYFGIPQHRTRIYIVGRLKSKGGLQNFTFPNHDDERLECDINTIIVPDDNDYMTLKATTLNHIAAWQKFLDILVENKITVPTFPVWAMEFGATYKYDTIAPYFQRKYELEGKKGKFGEEISGNSKDDCLQCLPIYAQTNKTEANRNFPDWKKQYIRQNRDFYIKNKSLLDKWLEGIKGFENSHQKFEWNCGSEEQPNIYDKIVQFRPSGIRVKKPTFSPALVLTTTQIPIFPWIKTPNNEQGRYMTRKEAAKLQCMEDLKECPDTIAKAFRAFGNAVNVEVVKKIAENL
ncbi:MAG: DNA (cytosine-5-)-methyltransferase, partial [Bacteroidales bacterium]|nr:DNA (cytosine-5-)-methyltransferase [Bacteroidales bacterium]